MVYIYFILLLSFGLVVLIGAPYLPTLKKQQNKALEILELKQGQTVLDLGCGDGRFLLAAAKCGYKAVGIEANPLLVIVAYFVTIKYRKTVSVKWGNIWVGDWPQTDAIYVFLHTRFMKKLDKKLSQKYNGNKIKVVSFAFEIPDKKIKKNVDGLFLYEY